MISRLKFSASFAQINSSNGVAFSKYGVIIVNKKSILYRFLKDNLIFCLNITGVFRAVVKIG